MTISITPDVIKDLLPLYVAGEASADTRAIVDAWLRTDAETAAYAAALAQVHAAPAGPLTTRAMRPGRVAGAGPAALAETKSLLRRKTWLMAAAIFCSGVPFTIAGGDEGVRFFMLRDAPRVAMALLTVAAVCWVMFGLTVRRLRVTGL